MLSPGIKIAVLVLTVLLSTAYLIYDGVTDTMVYYLTVPELKRSAEEGERYRVSGPVEKRSIVKKRDGEVSFSISGGSDSLEVSYRGEVPDTFTEGVEAVVEGIYRGSESFEADLLLAKCPTKYESADGLYPESDKFR
ncbi:MAG: cytochrome c maturation protein CcmE [Candidatus Mycalebacterium zealandia]|nr:MAG: cytochrome c maturation protein CcmE [Candidatus Mycalebacterium zealandia]